MTFDNPQATGFKLLSGIYVGAQRYCSDFRAKLLKGEKRRKNVELIEV